MLGRATTADVLAPLIAPLAGGPPHSGPPPGAESAHPAVTINRFGAGRAAFVALPIATDYLARGHAALEPLLAGLVRRVCEPLVELESETPVEVTVLQRGRALFVHLVNYAASRLPGRPATVDRVAPVHDVEVTLRLEREPAFAEGAPEPVRWLYRAGLLTVNVPRLGLWACVEIGLA